MERQIKRIVENVERNGSIQNIVIKKYQRIKSFVVQRKRHSYSPISKESCK